ncbi:MAG: methylenetetrahydrofolate reductase [NAD(P)H] [Thermovirgaceae bacterium]|nr:methylenetetrahydrofolate reductase [NAD(P)H] [Thermovirgaceae bacterium]
MFIRDIYSDRNPVISFEIFPPKRDFPLETVYETVEALHDLEPDFISVTYGAGGSSRDRTVEIASELKCRWKITPLAHLTCLGSSREEIDGVLGRLEDAGIRNVLALRGDPPGDGAPVGEGPFRYAADLISHIHEKAPGKFSVAAAAYPEGHVECDSPERDIEYLKRKVDRGVDILMSQLFFDNEIFFRFAENLDRAGINVPIVAGIMPILKVSQISRIVSLCGASIPPGSARLMARYENSPEALYQAGISYATGQIVDLLAWGVRGIHLYTMNRPDAARSIMENITSVRKAGGTREVREF